MRENHSAFHKIWFRPRVLVDVEKIDLSTTMLGTPVSIPFYVTATALGKLGNPEGEVILTVRMPGLPNYYFVRFAYLVHCLPFKAL